MNAGDVGQPLPETLERRDAIGRDLRDRLARALHVAPRDVAAISRIEAQAMLTAIALEHDRNPDRP